MKEKSESKNEIEIAAVVGNVVVGTAGVEAIGKKHKVRHRAEFGISVAKEFWGLGIGQALMAVCIKCARAAGYIQLELNVVTENTRALSMYEKAGFVEYGRNPKGFCSRMTGFQEVIYILRGAEMKIGEVCLLTNDVIRLSNFYKMLFNIENHSTDDVHQFIIAEETTLTVYNDGSERKINSRNICIAFTVEDVDVEFKRLTELGVEIVDPPTIRPWGAKNMSFLDPDNNLVTFRCFSK